MADSVSSVEGGECNLAGYLTGDRALLLDVHSKHEVLDRLIDCLAGSPKVASREELAAGVYEREKLMSTGIGLGIAIPHVWLASVSDLGGSPPRWSRREPTIMRASTPCRSGWCC